MPDQKILWTRRYRSVSTRRLFVFLIAEFIFETPTVINDCYIYLTIVVNIVTVLTIFTLVLFVFIC